MSDMNLDEFLDDSGPLTADDLHEALDLLTQVTSALNAAAESKYADAAAYRKRNKRLARILKQAGIRMPFLWDSLDEWQVHSKAEFPQNYVGRRAHIKDLGGQVRSQLERRLADISVGDPQSALTAVGDLATNTLSDPSAIKAELRRLEMLLPIDPGAVIGKAKNLVEATAKAVLTECGLPISKKANVPDLVEAAMRALGVHPDQLTSDAAHDPIVADIAALLKNLAIKVNQLRNRVGDGHAPATAITGIDLRHGRLAARTAITWSSYILETLHDQDIGQ